MHTTWMLEEELTELDTENKDYMGVSLSVCFLIGEHVPHEGWIHYQGRSVFTATHWRCSICSCRKSPPDSGWTLCTLSSMHIGIGEQCLPCSAGAVQPHCSVRAQMTLLPACYPVTLRTDLLRVSQMLNLDLELCLMKLPQYLHACLVNRVTASS